MKIMKKNVKSFRRFLIAIIIIIVVATAGFFLSDLWQNSSPVSPQINSNANSGRLPNSNSRIVPEKKPLKKAEADHISIPDRLIEAPVVYIEETNEKTFQEALTKGVVHYPGSPLPGEFGNPYIFGHSSDYAWKAGNYKKVFKPLVDIPVGTPIYITNHAGEQFVYKVKETKIVGPKDTSVLDQYNYERKMMTLQTSWPVGTALKRWVAIAELDEEATYGK